MNTINLFIRYFFKQKTTGFLCIGSLSLGITVALLTGIWCVNEFSFDDFHPHAEQTYRLTRKGFINNESVSIGTTENPIGPEIKAIMPELKEMARLYRLGNILEVDGIKESVNNVWAVDSTFYKVFDYPIKQGSIKPFLGKPNAIIINETWANKYFPGQNPIGQLVSFHGEREVVAVMHDTPTNTHLDINALVRIDGVSWLSKHGWGGNDGYATFVVLNEGSDINSLNKKITNHAYEAMPPYKSIGIKYCLQPLLDIHLGGKLKVDYAKSRDRNLVIAFILLAITVLFVACINFSNLFISNAFLRSKAVGIRKANGAKKGDLIIEFFTETLMYVCLATSIGIVLGELALPVFNQLIGNQLVINYTSPDLWIILLALIVGTTLLAGALPAFYLTQFNPVKTIKDQFSGKKIALVQKVLLVVQIAASVLILISTITIKKQVSHLQNMELGFNKENIIYMGMNYHMRSNFERISQELKSCPDILKVTAKTSLPIDFQNGNLISLTSQPDDEYFTELCYVKANYFDVLQMPIINGENTFHQQNDSTKHCLINERAAELLGGGDLINKQLRNKLGNGQSLIIKGIIKDAYTQSLREQVKPQVYLPIPKGWNYKMMIKTTGHPKAAIEKVKEIWTREVPDVPFEYRFLDERYGELYEEEEVAGYMAFWLMLISFLITVAGMYGMARYAIKRKTKEIGIRKVNGASLAGLVTRLNMSFIKLVAVAFIIAAPVAWFMMNQWLEQFAIRTNISWWIFLVTGLTTLFVMLFTVSYQTLAAANQNPVKCLRYE